MGALTTPAATISWLEITPTAEAIVAIPPRQATPWPDTNHPLDQRHTHQEGVRAQAHAQSPYADQEVVQWWDLSSPHHEPPLGEERIVMIDYTPI
jgi:hypothetical protein